jgi:phosphoglycerate dehydrogenase-like enzyme
MKTVLLPEWGAPFFSKLRERYPHERLVEAYSAADILREVQDADAVFGYLTREQFASARKLRWIQTLDAGTEGLFNRIPEVIESPVIVTNARGAGAPQIGEHALALILHFARGIHEFSRLQRQRTWDQDYGLSIVQMISGKTAGIIGFGKSGREIGWRCKAMGMHVIAVDKHPVDGDPVVEHVWGLHRLPDLLAAADYVVVTVPYTPENENMLGAKELALMKKTARLIVTSRGRIVEHKALVAALREGRIAGAGLDTVIKEPLPQDNELWDLPNVIITPHIAGNSVELDERTYAIFEENFGRFLTGQPLINQVDKRLRY